MNYRLAMFVLVLMVALYALSALLGCSIPHQSERNDAKVQIRKQIARAESSRDSLNQYHRAAAIAAERRGDSALSEAHRREILP